MLFSCSGPTRLLLLFLWVSHGFPDGNGRIGEQGNCRIAESGAQTKEDVAPACPARLVLASKWFPGQCGFGPAA